MNILNVPNNPDHTQVHQGSCRNVFSVTVIDVYSKYYSMINPFRVIQSNENFFTGQISKCCIPQAGDELANVSLIKAGYLGSAPMHPTVAITLECLELYCQIQCRQATFSLQSICKVLCAIHNVSSVNIYLLSC